ncbi:MAG: LPS assembly protein LptD [Rickettsiales bacterium]|nr:LPS assembly protein LptD [Rickettsiales bacterium]
MFLGPGAFGEGKNNVLIIEGSRVNSEIKKSVVSVGGGVKITQGEYNITADSVVYDRENGKIYLDRKVKMVDGEKNNMFAERAEISSNLTMGTFNNAGIILNRGISIVSERMEKEDDYNYFGYNSTYYFCPNSDLDTNLSYDDIMLQMEKDKIQVLSIYSKKSHVDRNKKRIYLDNVFIRFFNIPFFYLPRLVTSRELDVRVSGPSSPSLSKRSYYGYGISLPIKLYFLDNLDIILEPLVYQRGNFLLNSVVRFSKGERFYMDFLSSHIYDNNQSENIKNMNNTSEEDEGVHRNARMSYKLASEVYLGNEIYVTGNVGYVSDPYVVRDYFGDLRETLESSVSILKMYERSHLKLDTFSFQQIRERSNAGVSETPHFLLALEQQYSSDSLAGMANTRFYLKTSAADALNSFRNRDREYGKFNLDLGLGNANILNGLYIAMDLALHSSFYYRVYGNGTNGDNSRVYPEFSLKLSYPFFIPGGIVIDPVLQYFGSRKRSMNILDMDSKNSELNMNNLFSANRYSGHDLIETGNRINYGIRAMSGTPIGEFTLSLGQGYRDFIDNRHRIGFFEREFSHILLAFNYTYGGTSVDYINYIDGRDFKLDREDLFLNMLYRKLSLSVSYSHRSARSRVEGKEQTQINTLLGYRITEKLHSRLEISNDLRLRRVTGFGMGIIYEDGCYVTKFAIGRRNFENFFDRNDTSISFNFRIKN